MFVLAVKLTIYLPLCQSLKDKRRLRRQLIDRFHKRVIIKEIATQDIWQTLTVGFCLISLRESDLSAQLDQMVDDMIESGEMILQQTDCELIKL